MSSLRLCDFVVIVILFTALPLGRAVNKSKQGESNETINSSTFACASLTAAIFAFYADVMKLTLQNVQHTAHASNPFC